MIAKSLKKRTLTSEELAAYHANGYVLVTDIFSVEELEAINREIDRLLEDKQNEGHNAGWVMQLGLRSETTRQFAQDERILSLIEDIVKPGIAIYSGKLTAKLPKSDEICHWHQDDAYYTSQSISQTRMSVWIPLQDTNEANGCLWIVPKSHRWGLQPHQRREWGQCRLSMPDASQDFSGAIPCPIRAGDVLLFSALLWHQSKGNTTSSVRRAFIISYQEAAVPRGNGRQWKILRQADL